MEERKQLADYAVQTHSISLHRACDLLKLSCNVYDYQDKKVVDEVLKRLSQQLTQQYPRYGFGNSILSCTNKDIGLLINVCIEFTVKMALI